MLPYQDVAAALRGLPVIFHTSDPRFGTMIELGERRQMRVRVRNPTLTEEQRMYEGSHSLFIRCAWGWTPRKSAVSPIDRSSQWKLLDALAGSSVLAAEFTEPSLELRLGFDNGLRMWVNPAGKPLRYKAYTVRIENLYWSVYSDGHTEESDPAQPKPPRPVIV